MSLGAERHRRRPRPSRRSGALQRLPDPAHHAPRTTHRPALNVWTNMPQPRGERPGPCPERRRDGFPPAPGARPPRHGRSRTGVVAPALRGRSRPGVVAPAPAWTLPPRRARCQPDLGAPAPPRAAPAQAWVLLRRPAPLQPRRGHQPGVERHHAAGTPQGTAPALAHTCLRPHGRAPRPSADSRTARPPRGDRAVRKRCVSARAGRGRTRRPSRRGRPRSSRYPRRPATSRPRGPGRRSQPTPRSRAATSSTGRTRPGRRHPAR